MALNAKANPNYVAKRINGKFAPGWSGNPGGSQGRPYRFGARAWEAALERRGIERAEVSCGVDEPNGGHRGRKVK